MLYIFTGNGKGKTTAAIGTLVRSYGAGKSCAVIYFDKISEHCNELSALLELGIHSYVFGADRIEGEGFRFEHNKLDYLEVEKALNRARELVDRADVLVLDEFLNVLRTGQLGLEKALQFVDEFPKEKYLVLTGRGLHPEIESRADLISEINNIRHPFDSGVKAQKGIDY